MKYKVGDKVKIIDQSEEAEGTEKECYLGTIMTIKNIGQFFDDIPYYFMEEDDGLCCWYEDLIEGQADSITQIDSVVESSSGHLIKGENDIYTINW